MKEEDIFNYEKLEYEAHRLKQLEIIVDEEISCFDETLANTFQLTYARNLTKTEEQLRKTKSKELEYILKNGKFHDYDLYTRIGKGGVGIVFLAGKDGEKYALKVPKTEYDAIAIELEIEILAISLAQNINLGEPHENIIAFKDSYERAFAAEFLPGQIQLVKNNNKNGTRFFKNIMQPDQLGIPSTTAVKILLDLLDATDYIHKNGIYHRDIKWENLLFTKQDPKTKTRTTKLYDFGAAFNINWLDNMDEFRKKYIEFWTPSFVGIDYVNELKQRIDMKVNPPSKEEAKEIFEKREDFAIGATLYHLLTGRRPYTNKAGISYANLNKKLTHIQVIEKFKPFNYELLSQAGDANFWIKTINMLCRKETIKRKGNLHDKIRYMVRRTPTFSQIANFEDQAKKFKRKKDSRLFYPHKRAEEDDKNSI